MAQIGHGYGSEWHLLRYLGRHRHALDARVTATVGATAVEWLDFPVDPNRIEWPDNEWKGLDFLEAGSVLEDWRSWWPHGRGIQTWDAVGRVRVEDVDEWLLVEAKAHTREIVSSCGAETGLRRIESALNETKGHLGAPEPSDWLSGYYQYANRLAALSFLDRHAVPARLLFIYFVGHAPWQGRDTPLDEHGWTAALAAQEQRLGVPAGHPLENRVHKLFLHIRPDGPEIRTK